MSHNRRTLLAITYSWSVNLKALCLPLTICVAALQMPPPLILWIVDATRSSKETGTCTNNSSGSTEQRQNCSLLFPRRYQKILGLVTLHRLTAKAPVVGFSNSDKKLLEKTRSEDMTQLTMFHSAMAIGKSLLSQ